MVPRPIIVFQVNLELNSTEQVGPNTNSHDTGLLHPDRCVGIGNICGPGGTAAAPVQGSALSLMAQRKYTRSALVEQLDKYSFVEALFSPTSNFKHGDYIALFGQNALDAKNKFASGSWNNFNPTAGLGPILTIITQV
jgi:hypothetical protein